MRSKSNDDALPGLSDTGARRGGAIYRGVCLSISTHVDAGELDRDRDAGTLALARALAHQADLAGGYAGNKREPYAVASLARELRVVLELLAGNRPEPDTPAWLLEDDDPDALPGELVTG